MGGKEPTRREKFMDNREMLKMYTSAISNSNLKWDAVKMGQLVKSYFRKIKISVLCEKPIKIDYQENIIMTIIIIANIY